MVIYGAQGLTARTQARELLALAAAEHWGLAPLPTICRLEKGKPYFPEAPARHFNLSHSGDLAVCALDGSPVGVDIQIVKDWRPALPKRVCSAGELKWLEAQEDRRFSFAALWALKESRVKESGQGLTVPIREIRIPLPGPEPQQLDGLWFAAYRGENWAGAVCGHTPPPRSILWRSL